MKTIITQGSQLNSCWSALQYTDSCHECDKVFTCRVKSKQHANGINRAHEDKLKRIKEEYDSRLNSAESAKETALKLINKK